MKKLYKIQVRGKVQGVWYRGSTLRKATALGLYGFVRNEPDGSVYIEAEGRPQQLDALVEWCHRGPELARVSEVQVAVGEPRGYVDFAVRR